MVAAELAVGIVFVAVCVSIPPCLLAFSSSIENLFTFKKRFRSAEVDSDAAEEPDDPVQEEEGDETPSTTRRRQDPSKESGTEPEKLPEGTPGSPAVTGKRPEEASVPEGQRKRRNPPPSTADSLKEELKPKNA